MNLNRLKGEIVAVYGTQNNFANAINWDYRKVSKMVTGKYVPDINEVAEISKALNLSMDTYQTIFILP